ncbi:hypothetical protein BCE02nite_51440 [Brevibacillus centrosporus]|nr:hypothetical protein BCE02nite_51440 [Brevibacillus centrosporus]
MEGLVRIFNNCACCGVRFEMYHHGDYWCDRCAKNIPDPDGEGCSEGDVDA